jgi:hypothetical protein
MMAGEENSILIVGVEVKDRYSDIYKIIEFSKNKGIIERNKRITSGISLVRKKTDTKSSRFLWFVNLGVNDVFRFDKETFELAAFVTQHEVTPLKSNMGYSPYMADENYIWIAIPYYIAGEKFYDRGYLVRISKADASYEVMPVFSERKEILKRIALYFLGAILILSPILSLILGFSNIPKLKYLKGWKPTALITILSILFIIFSPTLKDELLGIVIFIPALLFGLTSILLSRILVYLIKLTRFKIISWLMTLSLSLFSGGLFGLLFLGAYRFVSGEAALGLFVIAVWGAAFVSFISLIVNIRERIS